MSKDFVARHLDVKAFALAGGAISGRELLGANERLVAQTLGQGADLPIDWSATGELRNPEHLEPQIWLNLQGDAVLPLTCQRCLGPIAAPVTVKRSFRFVSDESVAAAQDNECEEDVLALSRGFDLIELLEDELLMDLPVAPRHEVCPVPVKLEVVDADFEAAQAARENPFAMLGTFKPGKGN